MSSAGVPLRVIQEISGHRSLQALQRYLEVPEGQLEGRSEVLSKSSPGTGKLSLILQTVAH
ncbi:hypothetical protein NDA01_31040 [Trichocoleus desertorum AS-A10]